MLPVLFQIRVKLCLGSFDENVDPSSSWSRLRYQVILSGNYPKSRKAILR